MNAAAERLIVMPQRAQFIRALILGLVMLLGCTLLVATGGFGWGVFGTVAGVVGLVFFGVAEIFAVVGLISIERYRLELTPMELTQHRPIRSQSWRWSELKDFRPVKITSWTWTIGFDYSSPHRPKRAAWFPLRRFGVGGVEDILAGAHGGKEAEAQELAELLNEWRRRYSEPA